MKYQTILSITIHVLTIGVFQNRTYARQLNSEQLRFKLSRYRIFGILKISDFTFQ